jgi:hypothetical protein
MSILVVMKIKFDLLRTIDLDGNIFYYIVIRIRDNTFYVRQMYIACPVNVPVDKRYRYKAIEVMEKEVIRYLLYDNTAHNSYISALLTHDSYLLMRITNPRSMKLYLKKYKTKASNI